MLFRLAAFREKDESRLPRTGALHNDNESRPVNHIMPIFYARIGVWHMDQGIGQITGQFKGRPGEAMRYSALVRPSDTEAGIFFGRQ